MYFLTHMVYNTSNISCLLYIFCSNKISHYLSESILLPLPYQTISLCCPDWPPVFVSKVLGFQKCTYSSRTLISLFTTFLLSIQSITPASTTWLTENREHGESEILLRYPENVLACFTAFPALNSASMPF